MPVNFKSEIAKIIFCGLPFEILYGDDFAFVRRESLGEKKAGSLLTLPLLFDC